MKISDKKITINLKYWPDNIPWDGYKDVKPRSNIHDPDFGFGPIFPGA